MFFCIIHWPPFFFGGELALIRACDKSFLWAYYVQGAWRCHQTAWFMQAPLLRRTKVPHYPIYFILWEMVRSSGYFSIWKNHWGEGFCCYSRQRHLADLLLFTDNCSRSGWESSPFVPLDLSFLLQVPLTDPEGNGRGNQRAGQSKTKLEIVPHLRCWLRKMAKHSEVLRRFASESEVSVPFFKNV